MRKNAPFVAADIGTPSMKMPTYATNGEMAIFFLPCDGGQLNQTLDTYINQPSGGRYKYRCLSTLNGPLLFMILSQVTIDPLVGTDGEVFGKERYSELSFFIPCFDRNLWRHPLGEGLGLAIFNPALFPDSAAAVSNGRETYGFRKIMASYDYPGTGLSGADPRFTARASAFKVKSPDSFAAQHVFAAVDRFKGGKQHKLDCQGKPELVRKALRDHFLGEKWLEHETGEALADIADDFLDDLPTIFLKQFPSIENSTQAQTSTIARAPYSLQALNGGGIWMDAQHRLQKVDIRFPHLASLPLVTSMGIKATTQGDEDLVQATGMWVNCDFGLELGETMWINNGGAGSLPGLECLPDLTWVPGLPDPSRLSFPWSKK